MKFPESDLQKACVKWFYLRFPSLLIYKIPNEGKRSPQLGKIFAMQGQVAGMPDLCIPISMHGYNSLYIELKSGKGTLTPKQKLVHSHLEALGNRVTVQRTIEGFIKEVENYLK